MTASSTCAVLLVLVSLGFSTRDPFGQKVIQEFINEKEAQHFCRFFGRHSFPELRVSGCLCPKGSFHNVKTIAESHTHEIPAESQPV